MCGSTEIDGYAFCLGLHSLNLRYEASSKLQGLIGSAAYLIKRTVFRLKSSGSVGFSLDIRPLGELVDMYHNREATDRRDKIYALLGMSSDGIPTGMSPDYKISWKVLFHRLVKSLVGEQTSVETWEENEIAVIKSMGCVLGEVSSVESAGDWNDTQSVLITLKSAAESLGQGTGWSGHCILHASAKSIQKGDVVCLLQGASRAAIIRLYEDYCAVITITCTPMVDKRTKFDWLDLLRTVTTFPCEFLLVWDWGKPEDGKDYEFLLNSRVPKYKMTELESRLDESARLRQMGRILGDLEKYKEAWNKLRKAIYVHHRASGKELPNSLVAIDNLAVMHRGRGDLGSMLKMAIDLLERRGDYTKITEKGIIQIARSFGHEAIALLLDQRGTEVEITEDVVKAAAENWDSGKEIIALLLDRRGAEVKITENVVKAAAENWDSGKEIIALLLDRCGAEVKITEDVVKAAAENWDSGKEIIALLLDRCGAEVKITEDVVKAAAGNTGWQNAGKEVMALLLDRRGAEVKITEDVVKAAAENECGGKEIIALLLDRCGAEVKITEDVVKAAAGNWHSGKEIIALLLDRRGAEVKITEDVVKAAAKNECGGKEIIALLLDRYSAKVKITENVVKAAVKN
jgi:hypothetical protein